jgi:hypothetical protein
MGSLIDWIVKKRFIMDHFKNVSNPNNVFSKIHAVLVQQVMYCEAYPRKLNKIVVVTTLILILFCVGKYGYR